MQIQRSGRVKQIQINVLFDSITDNASARVYVSRQSVSDLSTQASGTLLGTPTLAQVTLQGNFVTSGIGQPNGTVVFPMDDAISAGDFLYVGLAIAGTVTVSCDVYIAIDE